MGLFGEQLAGRDVAIGVVLSLALGLGLAVPAFLHGHGDAGARRCCSATCWASMRPTLLALAGLGVVEPRRRSAVIVAALAVRSLHQELAEAQGVPVRFVSVPFLAVVGVAVAECAQIVGVLLVFALMVGPAAAAQRLTSGVGAGLAPSALLAIGEAWGGLALAYRRIGRALLDHRAERGGVCGAIAVPNVAGSWAERPSVSPVAIVPHASP